MSRRKSLLHVRRARIRFTPKGVRVSPASVRVGGKSGINISRSGISTSTRTRFGTYNSKRGCSIPIGMFMVALIGLAALAGSLLFNAPSPSVAQSPAPTVGPSAPIPSVTPTFKGKKPSIKVTPAYWPCKPNQIKGNINSMIYHTPKMRYYSVTWENVQCFDTAEEAARAGFKPAKV